MMSIANIIVGGLLLGIAGSFHCIGMCGPLIMMLHGQPGQNTSTKWMLVHHLGRMTAYLLLTIIFYFLGKYSGMFQLQQGASLFGGLLLILGWIPFTQRWLSKWLMPLRNKIKINEIQTPYIKHFLWGIFNGTLPCGWVYSAIGASLITGHLLNSALFITAFGIASTPSLLAIAISGKKIGQIIPPHQLKWARWGVAIIGLMFVVRGANLGIPYLSPRLAQQKMSCCETH